jgi:acetylornithine deacetylase
MDVIALLSELIEARSPSGEEGPACEVVERALRAAGLEPRRVENSVWCERGRGERALIFASHLDTVTPAPGWTRDPWRAEVAGGRLFGLGSTDAKSCVAAMLVAFVATDPGPLGRLVFAATAEEEMTIRGNGLERALREIGPLSAGVIGEPTALAICNAQRGRLQLALVAEGRAGHASRPWEGVNAIEIAARDVIALGALAEKAAREGADPLVGRPTIVATQVEGGTRPNVIPARCEVTLDVRTTPAFDNDRAAARIAAAVRSRVEIRSSRFRPFVTPPEAPIARAARRALPGAEMKPFGGVSDLFFLPCEGVIVGPGDGRQSHQADESVEIEAVCAGVRAYAAIAREFFRDADGGPRAPLPQE